MRIDLISFVGRNCITVDQGQRLYAQIKTMLSEQESVLLDCAGVEVFASPFFNAGIGQLLRDFELPQLQERLRIENLGPGKDLLKRVLANSQSYYSDPAARKALDAVLDLESKGE